MICVALTRRKNIYTGWTTNWSYFPKNCLAHIMIGQPRKRAETESFWKWNTPGESEERFRAAETSCCIDRCSSSCMSMQASSIPCMLFILCWSLAMSILRSFMMSHSCIKSNQYFSWIYIFYINVNTSWPTLLVSRSYQKVFYLPLISY